MKKLNVLTRMLLLVALLVGSVSAWGADETITFSSLGLTNGVQYTSFDGSDYGLNFSLEFGNGANDGKYYTTGEAIRVYGGGHMIVSSPNTISKIELSFGSGDGTNTITTNVGTYSNSAWSGESKSVTFNVGGSSGNRRIASVAVTYKNDNRTAVNLTSFTATKTTLLKGEEVETSVSNDQDGWTAAYTYSSDNGDVVTIDTDGKITAVAKGSTTVRATLNVDNDDPDYKTGSTYTRSIEITVNNPSHNVVFSENGVAGDPTSVEEGEAIVFPSDPASVGGKTFVGWVDTPIVGSTDDEPTLVTSAVMGDTDVTYYAVFATSVPGKTTITDELNRATTGITGTDYGTWSGKTENSDAVYAGNSAGGNNSIQLRSSNSNSGIITTTSGGKAKKIVVDWNNNTTSGRTLDIYGKNEAYTSASNLYDNDKKGTKLGSIVYGTSTELTITGDYTYIGFRSNSGAMYLNSISIDWETDGYIYASYCTTIPTTVPVTISNAKYATFSSPYRLNFGGSDVKAYKAISTGDASVTLEEMTVVDANVGVLLHAETAKTYDISTTSAAATSASDNLLVSTATAAHDVTKEELDKAFVFGKYNDVVGFYKAAEGKTIGVGKSYLLLSGTGAKDVEFLSLGFGEEENETTSISEELRVKSEESAAYNLAGQKVGKDYKGIVVVNGKKYLRK